ncbi:MAG: branched-chain amino acid ABC transporter permease [Xanthobacteraceae bacterium]|nr:branched-chain amino acid ABC transporter permease [Xanthobacteraceae bacterium]
MILQILVIGVLSAAIYMLVALGFTLIFGVMRIVNFAHGEFLMLGAYGLYVFMQMFGLPFGIALVLATAVTGVLGVAAEQLIFKRLVDSELGGMIASLALAISLQGTVAAVFGVDELAVERPVTGAFHVGPMTVPRDQLLAAGTALLLVWVVYQVLQRTSFGLAMRAVAQDRDVARLQGIKPRRIYAIAFGLSCALAGAAGALVAPLYTVEPYMGEEPLMKAFIVVVLGGLGSIPGALMAAGMLGLIDAVVSVLAGPTAATLALSCAVLLVLLARPAGLMGRA